MATVLEVRLSYAIGLKDTELLSKQDPYCVLQLGTASTRTRTHVDGGTRPVWNEVFNFNLMPTDQELVLMIKNANNITSDALIGMARVHLATVRQCGSQAVQAPVYCGKTGKQHGFVDLVLLCHAQGAHPGVPAMVHSPYPAAAAGYAPAPGAFPTAAPYQQQPYGAPMPGQYGVPQQAYGAAPQQGYGNYGAAPPPGYGYAPMPMPQY